MVITQIILFLLLVFVIMIILAPRVLYFITALYYLLQGSSKPKTRGKGIEFSLKDFKEVKEKKIKL